MSKAYAYQHSPWQHGPVYNATAVGARTNFRIDFEDRVSDPIASDVDAMFHSLSSWEADGVMSIAWAVREVRSGKCLGITGEVFYPRGRQLEMIHVGFRRKYATLSEKGKAYWAENKDRMKAKQAEYFKANREKKNEQRRARKARLRDAAYTAPARAQAREGEGRKSRSAEREELQAVDRPATSAGHAQTPKEELP